MTIRRARIDEVDQLTAIAHAAKSHWGYAATDLERWRDELTFTPESIDRWPTWVAVLDDAVVGVAQLQTTPHFELEALWVHPSTIGQGVGRQLVFCVVNHVVGMGGTQLVIDADPHAEGFYLQLGAVRTGTTAAPTSTDPNRVRPLLVLSTHELPNLAAQ